ncbi:hypothetical protein GCM10009828_071520 [Actinoplanes couchii]
MSATATASPAPAAASSRRRESRFSSHPHSGSMLTVHLNAKDGAFKIIPIRYGYIQPAAGSFAFNGDAGVLP